MSTDKNTRLATKVAGLGLASIAVLGAVAPAYATQDSTVAAPNKTGRNIASVQLNLHFKAPTGKVISILRGLTPLVGCRDGNGALHNIPIGGRFKVTNETRFLGISDVQATVSQDTFFMAIAAKPYLSCSASILSSSVLQLNGGKGHIALQGFGLFSKFTADFVKLV